MKIYKPWVILHELEHGTMECVLAGPEDVKMGHFALATADLVRHVASRFGCDEQDVMRYVQDELDMPTTEVSGSCPQ